MGGKPVEKWGSVRKREDKTMKLRERERERERERDDSLCKFDTSSVSIIGTKFGICPNRAKIGSILPIFKLSKNISVSILIWYKIIFHTNNIFSFEKNMYISLPFKREHQMTFLFYFILFYL